jgi:putative SOS response-associated peptidase YedK
MRRFVQAFGDAPWPPALPRTVGETLSATPPRYNIGKRRPAAVIFDRGDGPVVEDFDWGLVPRWSTLPQTPYTTVTARLARAPRSRIFRRPWETRRCVVPMNGYYKWDRSGETPVPYFIQAQDGEPLFAAGLWDHWAKDTPELYTFAVLTHPNPAIPAPLVPDGPVFMPAAAIGDWLAGPPAAQRFLETMPQPLLEAYPVSRRIRSPDVDDYTLLEPAPHERQDDETDGDWLAHAFDEDDD